MRVQGISIVCQPHGPGRWIKIPGLGSLGLGFRSDVRTSIGPGLLSDKELFTAFWVRLRR